MIWSFYIKLGLNMWYKEWDRVIFDDASWKQIVSDAVESGINMIVLDLGEGVQYASHPELAHPGAWTRERVREEVRSLREKGITLIPKLNFSATHHLWLGEYRWMMSTTPYYNVCRDLIYEVCRLFDNPPYVHLGMDEEGESEFVNKLELVAYRRGKLIWHDLQFLCDCVRDCGSKPWIWGDWYMKHPEEFRSHIKPGSVVLSPWYYWGYKPEHYTEIAYVRTFNDDLNHEPYLTSMKGMTYMEDGENAKLHIATAANAALDGYEVIPCSSNWGRNPYNTEDTLEYFKTKAPGNMVLGYMTAPWKASRPEDIPIFKEAFTQLEEAREKFYGKL